MGDPGDPDEPAGRKPCFWGVGSGMFRTSVLSASAGWRGHQVAAAASSRIALAEKIGAHSR
jgi:hypothetical protein